MHVVMDRSIAEAAAAAADAASSSSLLPDEPSGSGGGGGGGGAGSAAPGGGFGGLGFGLENPGPAQWQGQEAAAWREQLHDKLLPVAVGLYRSGRLGAVLEQMRDNAAAEAKALVREVSTVLKERRPRAAGSWAAWGPDLETVGAGHGGRRGRESLAVRAEGGGGGEGRGAAGLRTIMESLYTLRSTTMHTSSSRDCRPWVLWVCGCGFQPVF